MRRIILIVAVVLFPFIAFSQATGDYRSAGSGLWATGATWQRWNGAAWVTPASGPTSADGAIDVLSPHIVTVAANVTVDQVTVEVGATVVINTGISLTVANPNGTTVLLPEVAILGTLTLNAPTGTFAVNVGTATNRCFVNISGTINNAGNFTLGANSRVAFQNAAVYDLKHTTDAGTIPFSGSAVTWSSSSTCQITGYTTNSLPPTGLTQAFGNFLWNTQNLNLGGGAIDLGGALTTVTGNLTVNSVGPNGDVLYFSTGTSYALTVSNNLIINDGITVFVSTGATANITVTNGVFINNGNNFLTDADGTVNLTTGGSFYVLGGDFDFAPDPASNVTVNVGGDVAFNSPLIVSSAGVATLNFTGLTQNFFASNFITGKLNYHVASSTALTLTGTLSGAGTLVVDGTIILTDNSATGALQTGATGNVQVTGTRTFNSGSTIVYGPGTTAIGNGHPSTTGVNTTVTGSGVTLAGNTTIGGNLTLVGGNLTIGARTLTINGNFTPNGNSLVASTASSLSIGGTGAFGTLILSGSTTITNFTINRTSTGSVTLGSDLNITGTFNETAGDLLLNGHMLTIGGNFVYGSGTLGITATSSIVIEGSGTASTLSLSGTALNVLTINRTGAAVASGNTFTLTSLNLWAGTFTNTGTITMSSGGAVVSRDGGFLSNSLGAASTFDIVYLNTTGSAQNTGPELPSSTSLLRNLTINSANPINLAKNITINGDLTFTNGIFDAGSFTIDLKGNLISNNTAQLTSSLITFSNNTTISGGTAVTFGAITVTGSLTPNANLNVNGNLINNGTLNSGSATTTFGGATTISGSSTSSFNNVVIAASSTLTAPANFNVAGTWTNNGTFTHGASTNTVTFNGTTVIGGSAVSPQSDFSGIIINPSSTVTAPAVLNVGGVFTDNGTFVAGSGTVVLNGPVNQSINGSTATTFTNLSTSNPGTVTVATNKSITGALTLLSGAGVFNANGKVTMISNASGDAYIAPVVSGTITGAMTVQRYLPEAVPAKAYRYLASPVTNAVVSDWKNEFPITGSQFSDPSTAAEWPGVTGMNVANPSLFVYNEAHTPTTTVNDRYEAYPTSGSSTAAPLVNGKGYAAFVRFASNITIDVTGTPRVGAVGVAVTNQSGSTGGNDGWNLVGNPYAAPISWDNVTLPSGLSATIALKDNVDNIGFGSGSYIYYTRSGTGIPSTYHGTIASGQAFNVRATSSTTLNFAESNKTAVASPIFIREGAQSDIARVHLSGANVQDEMVIDFTSNGSDKADVNDGFKLTNDFVNLYSFSSDSTKMAINEMGPINCAKLISVGVDNIKPGSYEFTFAQMDSFDGAVTATLLDSFTGKTVVMTNTSKYAFNVTADAASYGTKRFKITFSSGGLPTALSLTKANVCVGADATISVNETKQGLIYALTMNGNQVGTPLNGNGQLLSFLVNSGQLKSGINKFVVNAYTNSCPSGYSQKDSISVESLYSVTQASSTTSCQSGPITLTAKGAPANGFYRWYVLKDDTTPINGQNSNTYQLASLDKTTTYYVAAVNTLGCEGERVAVTAPVVKYADAVITQVDAVTLSSNFPSGNHWSLNGEVLSDTTATLSVKESGEYTLEVKIGTCGTSASVVMVVTGLEGNVSGISGYPNPVSVAQGLYTVEIADGANKVSPQLPIFNILGAQVGSMTLVKQGDGKKGQFDFSAHATGVYFIRIAAGDEVKVLKVIKK